MKHNEYIFKLHNDSIGSLFFTGSIVRWETPFVNPQFDFDWLQNNSGSALSSYKLDIKRRCRDRYEIDLSIDWRFWEIIYKEKFNVVDFYMRVYEKPSEHSFLSHKGMIQTLGVEPMAHVSNCYMVETKYCEDINGDATALLRIKGTY